MQVIESTYVVALRDYPEEVPAKERIAAEARYAKILEKQLGGPEQVAAALLRYQKAIAIGMAYDAPPDQISLVGNQPVAAPVLHQLGVARHGSKPALKGIELLRLDIQQFDQTAKFKRRTLRRSDQQDVLAARQRVLVLRLLALEFRIGAAYFGKLSLLGFLV